MIIMADVRLYQMGCPNIHCKIKQITFCEAPGKCPICKVFTFVLLQSNLLNSLVR